MRLQLGWRLTKSSASKAVKGVELNRNVFDSRQPKLAKYYNTSVDYLLGLTDEIEPYRHKNIPKTP